MQWLRRLLRRRTTPDPALLAAVVAAGKPADTGGGWRYEPLATSYANTETMTKAAEAGIPSGLLVTERAVEAGIPEWALGSERGGATPPWRSRSGRSELDLWIEPVYRAASGNPLPQGWARAECVGCERRTLVNAQLQCVDCAGHVDLRA